MASPQPKGDGDVGPHAPPAPPPPPRPAPVAMMHAGAARNPAPDRIATGVRERPRAPAPFAAAQAPFAAAQGPFAAQAPFAAPVQFPAQAPFPAPSPFPAQAPFAAPSPFSAREQFVRLDAARPSHEAAVESQLAALRAWRGQVDGGVPQQHAAPQQHAPPQQHAAPQPHAAAPQPFAAAGPAAAPAVDRNGVAHGGVAQGFPNDNGGPTGVACFDDSEARERAALERREHVEHAAVVEWFNRVPSASILDHRAYVSPYKPSRASREDRALDKEEKRRTSELEEWRRRRQHLFLKSVVLQGDELRRFQRSRRVDAGKCARACRAHVDGIQHKIEVAEARISRKRLAALRTDDADSYKTLLEETKKERLAYLLASTDDYIRTITDKVKDERRQEQAKSSIVEPPESHPAAVPVDGPATAGPLAAFAESGATSEYYRVTHQAAEEVRQPLLLSGGALKPYQVAGLNWLVSLYNNRLNGILADEMGLGKTIQTIALLAHLVECKANPGPFLIVVPLSTLSNWTNEFLRWSPGMRVLTYNGPAAQRKDVAKALLASRGGGASATQGASDYHCVLTTYEYVMRDRSVLKKIGWEYIVVDEGHRMKNAESKFSQTLGSQYTAKRRLLLTGTPLQNSLPELWALLNFLLPSIFSSADTFEGWFSKPFAEFSSAHAGPDQADGAALSHEERLLIINRLHEVLRPFVLRRIKANVLGQLPDKVEKVLRCDLTAWQATLYEQIRSAGVHAVSEEADSKSSRKRRNAGDEAPDAKPRGLNNVLMQLRKVVNHPYLFRTDQWVADEAFIRASGKFVLLDSMLPKLKAAGHRVLLFSQMTSLIDLLEDFFHLRGFDYLRLDGSTPAEEREKRMAMFNDASSPAFVFLLSTRAGGLGLNLATADTVIIFDSDWNPMMDAQAQDRAHRIGQRHEVRVYRLISASPVEERILARATEKLNVNNLVVEAGQFAGASQSEDRKSMVEDLLREYTANGAPVGGKQDVKQEGDPEDDGDDLLRSEMATSADELALYQRIDAQRQSRGHVLRNMEADEVPVWLTGETQPAAEARAAEARAAAAGASAGRAGRRSHARPSASFAYEAVGTPGALRVTLKRRQN